MSAEAASAAPAPASPFPGAPGLSSTVLVTNISPLVDAAALEELFGECGSITNLPLQILSVGAARCCEITFETVAQAQAAALFNGVTLGAPLEIKIKPLPIPLEPVPPPAPARSTGPIDTAALAEELRQKASDLLAQVPHTSPSALASGADLLRSIAQPGFSGGRPGDAPPPPARVSAAIPAPGPVISPQQQEEVRRTVHVGNVQGMATPGELREFFSQVGQVTYTKIADRNNNRAGVFAFVEFNSVPEAELAVVRLNGAMFRGQPLRVSKAINPIIKDQSSTQAQLPRELKVQEAMRRVQEAQALLKRKLARQHGSSSSYSSSSRRSRSRSRSRDRSRDRRRRSRSRSHNRDRRRSSRRSRSRSRSGSRSRRSSRRSDRRSRSRSRSPRGHHSSSSSSSRRHRSRSRSKERSSRRHGRDRERERGRSSERSGDSSRREERDRERSRKEDSAAAAGEAEEHKQSSKEARSSADQDGNKEKEKRSSEGNSDDHADSAKKDNEGSPEGAEEQQPNGRGELHEETASPDRVKKGRGHAMNSSRYRD